MKRAWVFCALVGFLWWGGAGIADACTCPPGKLHKSKKAASAIFAAKILSRVIHKKKGRMVYKVRVLRYWKGKLRKQLILREAWGPCSNYLAVGKRYLIFARRSKFIKGLSTQMCTGTGPYRVKRKWMKKLGKGKRPK